MKTKQLKWPKWTEQYEDIKENTKTIRLLTRFERTWGRLDRADTSNMARSRNLYRTYRKVN